MTKPKYLHLAKNKQLTSNFFKIITPPQILATQVTVLKMIFPLGNMHYIHARITLLRLFSKYSTLIQ